MGHETPAWVAADSVYHIRLRIEFAAKARCDLTLPPTAVPLLESVKFYHEKGRWRCVLFLLMPDHAHALLVFPDRAALGRIIGEWKKYGARIADVSWQKNFFDHRIRDRKSLDEKYAYIRMNPVVKGLCARAEDWPWWWSPESLHGVQAPP